MTLAEAARYMVPVSRSAAEQMVVSHFEFMGAFRRTFCAPRWLNVRLGAQRVLLHRSLDTRAQCGLVAHVALQDR